MRGADHIACGCWWSDELNKWCDLLFRRYVAIIGQVQLSGCGLFSIGEAVPQCKVLVRLRWQEITMSFCWIDPPLKSTWGTVVQLLDFGIVFTS